MMSRMRMTTDLANVLEVIQEEVYKYTPNEEGWPRHTLYEVLAKLNTMIEEMPLDPVIGSEMYHGGYFR